MMRPSTSQQRDGEGGRFAEGEAMRRLLLVTIALVPLVAVTALLAQSRSRQSNEADCATRCAVNRAAAPPECNCGALDAGGASAAASGATTPSYFSASQLFDALRAGWAASVATINDYTVVEKIDVAPVPIVHHYEKIERDGWAEFEIVPPTELARREAQASAQAGASPGATDLQANPTLFLDALAKGLDELGGSGGASGGLLGQLADGLRQVHADVQLQASEKDRDEDSTPAFLVRRALGLGTRKEALGFYHPAGPTPARRFERRPEAFAVVLPEQPTTALYRAALCRTQELASCQTPIPSNALLCSIGYLDRTVEAGDFIADGETYTIESAEEWWCTERRVLPSEIRNTARLVYVKMAGFRHAAGGFVTFSMEREFTDFRPVGSMTLAHRIRERLNGNTEVVRSVEPVRVNQGPPTQADTARIMGEEGLRSVPGAN